MTADNTNPDSSVFADNPKNAAKLPCESLKEKAPQENDDNPVHNFMKGLAYLSGINVEADHDLALRLITRAADTGLPIAYETLISMYQTSEGVERNYHTAIEWQKKYVTFLRKQAMEQKTAEAGKALLIGFENLGDRQQAVGDIRSAKESYQQMLECALDMRQRGWGSRRYLSVSYERLEEICIAEGDLNGAKAWNEKDLEISRVLADETGTMESLDDLSISYYKLGTLSILPKTERRAYLEQFVEIIKGLYQQTGLPSFQENIEEGQEELRKLNN